MVLVEQGSTLWLALQAGHQWLFAVIWLSLALLGIWLYDTVGTRAAPTGPNSALTTDTIVLSVVVGQSVMFLLGIAYVAGQVGWTLAPPADAGWRFLESPSQWLVFGTLATLGYLLAAWINSRRHTLSFAQLGFRRPVAPAVTMTLTLGSMLALIFYTTGMKLLSSDDGLFNQSAPLEALGLGLHWQILYTLWFVMAMPLIEEAFFRGVVLTALLRTFGVVSAVAVQSLLYFLSHGGRVDDLPFLLLGLITGYLFLRTKSLWPAVAVHATWNVLLL